MYEGVRIAGRNDTTPDFGSYKGVGAGTGATGMAARLQGYVGGRSFNGVAESSRLLEGDNLGVVMGFVEVNAFAEDVAVPHEHAAYLGVGRCQSGSGGSEVKSSLHEADVIGHRGHALRDTNL